MKAKCCYQKKVVTAASIIATNVPFEFKSRPFFAWFTKNPQNITDATTGGRPVSGLETLKLKAFQGLTLKHSKFQRRISLRLLPQDVSP